MVSDSDLRLIVKQAREGATTRKFSQSAELTLVLKDIDIKKGFNLNEVVILPHTPTKQASICVVGTGDTGTRARKAEVNRIIQPEELDRLGTNKREAVVDRDLRTFHVPNLRVVSTATFPTGGGSNPTMMLMMMALRSADQMIQEFKKS